jgi:hypothetical protein
MTLLNDPDHLRRCEGVRAARQLAATEARITAALIAMVHDNVLAVRLNVAKVLASVAKADRTALEAIQNRMKELESQVYFGDPHFRDTTNEAGIEYHTLADALTDAPAEPNTR